MIKTISGKNILKKAGIIIIITAIIFSSFNIAAETNQSNDKIFNRLISDNSNAIKQIPNQMNGRGDVIFSQYPYPPSDEISIYTSDSSAGYLCQDDFWGLTEPICDIHWWGLVLIYDGGWTQGNPSGMEFEIKIYEDNGGTPGAVIAVYSDLVPSAEDTGLTYYGFKMYHWEIDIPCIELSDGWISTQSTNCPDGSWFLWMTSPDGNFNAEQNGADLYDNLAFELTGETVPKICCEGSLVWENVKAGSTVTGTFKVCNCGTNDSLLNWEVTSYPGWGSWTFTPPSGTGLAAGDCETVVVSIVTPIMPNQNLTGQVTVCNSDNLSECCTIPVHLKTPRARTINGFTFLQWILEKYPNMFPILRKLLE